MNLKKIKMNKLLLILLAIAIAGCGNSKKKQNKVAASDITITGAGATFPLPYYNLAFKTWQDSTGIAVTYGGIGSGGGIRSLKDKIVDFGGSDAFLSDEELAQMPAAVIQIPTCIGAVVMAYNLEGVKGLKLTGDIIADIYQGKITNWNDARIGNINEGITLPDLTINPVYRSDGSGTTFVFSDYLSKVSPSWNETIGTGKALKWPAGIAAKGNPGVAGTISQTKGAIGYIGSEYAFALKIPTAQLQNKAGNFITPDTKSISAAASIDIPDDTRTMITNPDIADAYPISCFTWILLYQEQAYNNRSQEQAEATIRLVNWMIAPEAQKLTMQVNYSPLPETAVAKAKALLQTVTYNGTPVIK